MLHSIILCCVAILSVQTLFGWKNDCLSLDCLLMASLNFSTIILLNIYSRNCQQHYSSNFCTSDSPLTLGASPDILLFSLLLPNTDFHNTVVVVNDPAAPGHLPFSSIPSNGILVILTAGQMQTAENG